MGSSFCTVTKNNQVLVGKIIQFIFLLSNNEQGIIKAEVKKQDYQ